MSTLTVSVAVTDASGNTETATAVCTINDTAPTRWSGVGILMGAAQ